MKTEAIIRTLRFWDGATNKSKGYPYEWIKYDRNCDEARTELAAIEAENTKMRDAIEGALRIKSLWLPMILTQNEAGIEEFKALQIMQSQFESAITAPTDKEPS